MEDLNENLILLAIFGFPTITTVAVLLTRYSRERTLAPWLIAPIVYIGTAFLSLLPLLSYDPFGWVILNSLTATWLTSCAVYLGAAMASRRISRFLLPGFAVINGVVAVFAPDITTPAMLKERIILGAVVAATSLIPLSAAAGILFLISKGSPRSVAIAPVVAFLSSLIVVPVALLATMRGWCHFLDDCV